MRVGCPVFRALCVCLPFITTFPRARHRLARRAVRLGLEGSAVSQVCGRNVVFLLCSLQVDEFSDSERDSSFLKGMT